MTRAAELFVLDDETWDPAYVAPKPQLRLTSGASLAGIEPPSRPWHVQGIIPGQTVSILSGDGGVGKTLLAMQLAAATATGTSWVGHLPTPGPVIFISAEDDNDELHRRLFDVAFGQGLRVEDLGDLHLLSLAGEDAVLAHPQGKSDTLEASPLFHAVEDAMTRLRPVLVILDPLADMFAGNEIIRSQARQFIGLLRGLALRSRAAVLLLSHPSQSGISSGSGASGSTAWNNSVRSRLYFGRPKADHDAMPDPDARLLKLMKANYGPLNVTLPMRWSNGVFVLESCSTPHRASEQEIDQLFLDLLARFELAGRNVSHTPCGTFAPKVFASLPDARGTKQADFKKSMERHFAAGRIKVVTEGPASKRRSRISLTSG